MGNSPRVLPSGKPGAVQFGGMPEGRVRDQLRRGERIRAILRQPQNAPLRLADEVALLLAVQSGLLDPLSLDAVATFRDKLPEHLYQEVGDALRAISETGDLNETARAALMAAMTRLATQLGDTEPAT
jgi:F-type H+/Na+-transporting ATPase subunit alpha